MVTVITYFFFSLLSFSPTTTTRQSANFTAVLPLEVVIHILAVGAFTCHQLAPLRLVNRALCAAASDPSLYRAFACRSIGDLVALPPFVANSTRRLSFYGNGGLDLGDVSTLVPNLTSLSAPDHRITSVDGADLVLRELQLRVKDDQDASLLSHLTDLERLGVSQLGIVAPIASLPRLTRLSLRTLRADPGELMSALAAAPCATTLEAFSLHIRYSINAMARWWTPLSGLGRLREFGLKAPTNAFRSDVDADGLAVIVADHPTLAVLDLRTPNVITEAMIRRGFSPNLKVLRFFMRVDGIDDVVLAALPPDLAALGIAGRAKVSAADVCVLMSHCSQLRALELNLDHEAAEYLSDTGNVGRALLLNRGSLPAGVEDALAAAGHRVGELGIGVHWRIAGGLMFDGRAVVGV